MRHTLTTLPVRRYLAATAAVVRDGLRTGPGTALLAVAAGAVGIASAAVSLWAVLLYARRAEAGVSLELLGRELDTSLGRTLLLVSIAAVVVGVISAVCLYAAESLIHRLARRHHERCLYRVLEAAARPDAGRIVDDLRRRVARPVTLIGVLGTCRYGGLALRSVIRGVIPLMYSLLAVGWLLWIDWRTTALLALIGGVYLVPLALINRAVARHHRAYRTLAGSAMGDLKQGVHALLGGGERLRDRSLWEPALLGSDRVRHLHDALYRRLLSVKRIDLLNGIFFMLCLFAVLAMAALGGAGGFSWTTLIAYVIGLRIAWLGFRHMTASLVTVSRFFPEYELFMAFADVVDRSAVPPARRPLEHPIDVRPASGGAAVSLAPGSVTLLLGGAALGRGGLEAATDALLRSAGAEQTAVRHLDLPVLLPGVPIEEQLGDGDAMRVRLESLGVMQEIDRVPPSLRRYPEKAELSGETIYAIAAAPLCDAEPAIVAIALRGLRSLRPVFQERLLEALRRHAVLLVDRSVEPILSERGRRLRARIAQVIVLDAGAIARCGDIEWLEQQHDEIEAILSRSRMEEEPDRAEVEDDEI